MTNSSIIELEIDEKSNNYAKVYSSLLTGEFQRKRAYASITALYALTEILEKTNNEVQSQMTIFKNPSLNEQYEITDLYVNNWHLDIRVITDGDGFLVPKSHYDNDILPDFYAVVKIDKELKNANLLGFADTKTMKKEAFDYHYYCVSNTNLMNYAEFLTYISHKKKENFTEKDHELFRESYLGLLDNELDKSIKNKILKHLFECSECRNEFCCYSGFEMVNKNLSKFPELMSDKTLNIIGAQDNNINTESDNNKFDIITDTSLQEDIVQLPTEIQNEQEPVIETQIQEVKEDSSTDDSAVTGILDELFNDDVDITTKEPENETIERIETIEEHENEINNITENEEEIKIIESDTETEELKEPQVQEVSKPKEEKVIIDYDENGEPIYSYITNLENTQENYSEIQDFEDSDFKLDNLTHDENSDFSEIEEIPDIEETTETYSENDNVTENIQNNITDQTLVEPENNELENNEEQNIQTSNVRTVEYYFPPEDENIQEPDDTIKEKNSIPEEIVYPSGMVAQAVNNNVDENNPDLYSQTPPEVMDFQENNNEEPDKEIQFTEIKENKDTQEYNSTDDVQENFSDNTNEFKEFEEYDNNDNKEYESKDNNDNDEEYEDEEETDDEIEYEDDDNEEENKKNSKKNLIIISLVITLLLALGGAFFFMKNINSANNTTQANNSENTPTVNNNDMFEQPQETSENVSTNNEQNESNPMGLEIPDTAKTEAEQEPKTQEETTVNPPIQKPLPDKLTEDSLLTNENKTTGDVNKVMSNAFNQTPVNVSLKGINWQCAPNLFTDKQFKVYLQGLDNTLKLNLKKNLLNASETNSNDTVSIKLAIDNNGNLIRSMIDKSSGSNQIDNIVLQSINETLETQKTLILSAGDNKADKYYLLVAIKL